jgi:hypothetical protein
MTRFLLKIRHKWIKIASKKGIKMDPYQAEGLPIRDLDYARLITKVGKANASAPFQKFLK